MSLLNFLFNWNLQALQWLLLSVLGVGVLIVSNYLRGLGKIHTYFVRAGLLLILAGIGMWVIVSFFQSLLENPIILALLAGGAFVIGVGFVLFMPEMSRKPARRRRRR